MLGILPTALFLLLAARIAPCSAHSTTLLGSSDSVEITDTELHAYYRTLAEKAVSHLNSHPPSGDADDHYWKLDRLVDVKRQVVEGVKYRLKLSVVRTGCRADGSDAARIGEGLCAVVEDALGKTCFYDIYVREWSSSDTPFERLVLRGCTDPPRSSSPAPTAMPRSIKPQDVPHWHRFTSFVSTHAKSYAGNKREMLRRFRIYKRNAKIAAMWQELDEGTAVYGETVFSDLSPSEFRRIYTPYRWQDPEHPIREVGVHDLERLLGSGEGGGEVPEEWDWRQKGMVTEVKNQGQCGSCWAFSVTGNVEGQWAMKTGKLVSLSEQELVDCDKVDQGCNGGLPANAYKEIIRMGGLEPENVYPYDAHGEQCHLVSKDIAVYINDSVQLPTNETYMAIWLFKQGPISIGLNAQFMQFYRHGISHPWKILCEPYFLDHGVLIVGYGVEKGKPFWVIKNSWGPKWGEQGYYRLYRGKDVCGVSQMATSSLIR